MSPATEALAALRDRVLALRDDLRRRLATAETIEPAWLAMLADAEAVLAALDRDG
jgi:hypothetical protein